MYMYMYPNSITDVATYYTLSFDWQEYTVEVEASEKPLVILHFLHNLKYRHVLCFTNSVESTHRQVTII